MIKCSRKNSQKNSEVIKNNGTTTRYSPFEKKNLSSQRQKIFSPLELRYRVLFKRSDESSETSGDFSFEA